MTQNVPPPIPSLVPETAPFSDEQRTWLNGFFAGLISLDNSGVTALSGDQAAALARRRPRRNADETTTAARPGTTRPLPLAERMKLAEGKPLRWKMMAAMAQQDCGQCGYDCKNYSGAHRLGRGRAAEPVRAGRQGNRPHGQGARRGTRRTRRQRQRPRRRAAPARCRRADGRARHARATIPSTARFSSRTLLNKPGSEKETWHVEFDLTDSGHRLHGRRCLRPVSAQRSGAGRRGHQGARRAAGFPDRRAHAARGADRRRVAVAGARHAVPAVLLHHRRRAAAEGAGAGRRRGPGRRRRNARRAGGDREIPRHPARSGSLHRIARSVAAAALFDLVVAQGRCPAASRSPSMPCATTSASATGSASASTLSGRAHRAGRRR